MIGAGVDMRASLDRLVNTIAAGLALIGGAGVVIMLVHITGYVALRLIVSAPIPATVEIVSSYYMVMIAFLPLAWAERRGEMISIEVFSGLYRGAVRRGVDVFVAVVTAAVYLVLTYTTWLVALKEFEAGSFVISLNVAIPTWPSYFLLPVGFALATVVALYRAAQAASGSAPRTGRGARP
jgi:TRAP-type C4-dicarboxylate transport system permease small subunit